MVARDTPQICVTRCRPWILPTEGETWRLIASGVPTRPVAWGGPRPPAWQRAGGLQPPDLGLEQLVGHGQIADLLLQAADLVITSIGRPGLKRHLASCQEGAPPAAQIGSGHPELAR